MYYQWREQQQQQPDGQLEVEVQMKPEEQQPQWLDQEPQYVQHQPPNIIKNPPSTKPRNQALFDAMQTELEKSKKGIKKNIMNKIYTKTHEIEYNVFVGETTDNKIEYLDKLYEHNTPNRFIKDQIADTVMETNNQIQNGIHRNQIKLKQKLQKIPKSKHQLQEFENQDHYRLLQIKQGQMKNKIGSLKRQFQHQTIKQKLRRKIDQIDQQQFQRKYYSIDHPKTKEASSFVKQLQYKSKQFQRQVYQNKAMEIQKKRQNQQQQRYYKEMQMQQRKTKLQEYYQNKLITKMQQKQIQKQKKQQFKEWIKQYQREKPLQLQKQEQYRMKYVIPELQQRHKKLMTIRAEHRPIDIEEIINHEQKYLQIKIDNTIRKRAELQLIKEENDMNKQEIDSRLYKGKYRFLVLEQMIDEKYPIQYRDIEQSKKDRIKAYNQQIRSVHQDIYQEHRNKVESDTSNHQRFIRRVRKMNGSMNITSQKDQRDEQILLSQRGERKLIEDSYQQGIKNLNYVKTKVRQQIEKQVQQPTIINLVQQNQYEKPKGFIEQKREQNLKLKKKQIVSQISKNIQKTSAVNNEQIGDMNAKLGFLDQRLKRKQMKLKNSNGAMAQQQGQKIQSDYVNAIKAKIHMLQQFK